MAELDQMKELVAMLKMENSKINTGTGDNDTGEVERLSALLASKQSELQNVLTGESDNSSQDEMMQQQREEYGRRGISLTHFESDTTIPHLINLDVDTYRSKRFMFLFEQDKTTVGSKGDIKPMSIGVVPNHCFFERDGESIHLTKCDGEVVHNGKKLESGDRVELTTYDRVAIGNDLMLFVYPGKEPEDEPPNADEAAQEYQQACQGGDATANAKLQEQLKKFEQEKLEWEKQKAQALESGATDEEIAAKEEKQKEEQENIARQVNDQELREVLPKLKELKQIVQILNRDMLSFDTALQGSGSGQGGIPKVKVKIHNSLSNETIFLDVFEFVKAHAILKDELAFLRNAISNEREYTSPEAHDPISLLFDNSFNVGAATIFPEYLLYNLPTDPEESQVNVKLAIPPFSTIGKLEVHWEPLGSPDKEVQVDVPDVEDPQDLLGKPWTYEISIKGCTGLPIITDLAYVQYEFNGELFTTETVEQNTRSPTFEYTFVHHVDCVTQSFIDSLGTDRVEFQIFTSPYVMDPPKDKISTDNPVIAENLGGQATVKVTYDGMHFKFDLAQLNFIPRVKIKM